MDLTCLSFRINKEILTREEADKILLFDPIQRKIHLFSLLAYQAWISLDNTQNLSSFMKINQLSLNEAIDILDYFLKEGLIIET